MDLYSRGFDVSWAWYSPPRHGCWVPPGPGTATELPTIFIVCLPRPDRGLEDWFNFERTGRPDSFGCPTENTIYTQ